MIIASKIPSMRVERPVEYGLSFLIVSFPGEWCENGKGHLRPGKVPKRSPTLTLEADFEKTCERVVKASGRGGEMGFAFLIEEYSESTPGNNQ
jgi:hypothetical protein